ncbi:Fic family protein [Roseovarius sp. S4756]|uniref:Fic family protein n=1 Tax=Roseovarius maritimus TaxID=3342637 RepID=UPI00372A2972
MTGYIWQNPGWPDFIWDFGRVNQLSSHYSHEIELFQESLRQLSTVEQEEYRIEMLALEASATSEIEGEMIDRETVKSSILGKGRSDSYIEKIVDFILEVDRAQMPLTTESLCEWQALVVRDPRLERGRWRTQPVQIMSGPIGRETVHYEGPPADRVPGEMVRFLDWFNRSSLPPPIKSGLSHLYFEMIHPFADGNGRVGRAVAQLALGPQSGLTALSAAILSRREGYYDTLEKTGKSDLDATDWLIWYLETLDEARRIAGIWMDFTRSRLRIESYYQELNDSQAKVIARMLREGPDGFKGGMTTTKYGKIADCVTEVAEVELAELEKKALLRPVKEVSSSMRYELVL